MQASALVEHTGLKALNVDALTELCLDHTPMILDFDHRYILILGDESYS